jgi:hypothetical protein
MRNKEIPAFSPKRITQLWQQVAKYRIAGMTCGRSEGRALPYAGSFYPNCSGSASFSFGGNSHGMVEQKIDENLLIHQFLTQRTG